MDRNTGRIGCRRIFAHGAHIEPVAGAKHQKGKAQRQDDVDQVDENILAEKAGPRMGISERIGILTPWKVAGTGMPE